MTDFNSDGKIMSDKMLTFILEYLENETKSTSELVRKLTEMVGNIAASITTAPTRRDIYDSIKFIETDNELKVRDVHTKLEAYNRESEIRRRTLQEVVEQKSAEVDKCESVRFDELRKSLLEQFEKAEESQKKRYEAFVEMYRTDFSIKLASLDTNVVRLLMGLGIAVVAITFILGFLKWGGTITQ